MTSLNSAFYIGQVFHKRFSPKVHRFDYPLYMAFLDLDEIEVLHKKYTWFSAQRWAPLQFKATDYFKGNKLKTRMNTDKKDPSFNSAYELKMTAINIANRLGANTDAINRVCMLAQLRSFGLYFSPVNFFFLYENNTAKYLLAEVSNTPWNEKHCYLMDVITPKVTPKDFHVSPFMDLKMDYRWTIRPPQESTLIRIENWNKNHLFTAIFSAQRYEICPATTRKIFLKWPVMAINIVQKIYWQAVRLFFKGIRYVPYQTKDRHNS